MTPPRPLWEDDDRLGFDCGDPAMNTWLQRHGWSNHRSGDSRVYVLNVGASNRIVGFVTLSAAQIERTWLPKQLQRNRANPVPVTLLGRLAVDTAFQARGHATTLLQFALSQAIRAADSVASAGVVVHPLNDRLRSFYRGWGFDDLPGDAHRAMMVRMEKLRLSA